MTASCSRARACKRSRRPWPALPYAALPSTCSRVASLARSLVCQAEHQQALLLTERERDKRTQQLDTLVHSFVHSLAHNKSMDYTRFLSRRALRLLPSAIRALQPLVSLPSMISLGGGYPNARLFPFKGLTLQVPAPPSHSSAPAETVKLELSPGKVAEALQYSPSYGLPSLLEKLSRLQKVRATRETALHARDRSRRRRRRRRLRLLPLPLQREHRPPRDTKILVTTGSQDALSKVRARVCRAPSERASLNCGELDRCSICAWTRATLP